MGDIRKEVEHAINRCSAENGSNTPDFILAEFLTDCLAAFDKASRSREKWYGAELHIGMRSTITSGDCCAEKTNVREPRG